MNNLEITCYTAVIKGYRKFPDITFTISTNKPCKELKEIYKYHAESDYAFLGPGNPARPYRHHGDGATIEDAVRGAMNTFISQDVENFDNSEVFITKEKENFNSATFIDGNSKKVSYEEARNIVLKNRRF